MSKKTKAAEPEVMYNLGDKKSFQEEFKKALPEKVKNNSVIDQDLVELTKNENEFNYYLRSTVVNTVLSALPVGVPTPKLRVRASVMERVDGQPFVSVLFYTNSSSSPVELRFQEAFSGESLNPGDVVGFFANAIEAAVISLMQYTNVAIVNNFYAGATTKAGVPFTVSFKVGGVGRKKGFVQHISDDAVEFTVDGNFALQTLPNLRIFDAEGTSEEGMRQVRASRGEAEVLEGDEEVEITDADKHRVAVEDAAIDDLRGLVTPVDLLKSRNTLIRMLAGINTHTPTTLIRNSEKRKIQGVTKNITKGLSAIVENESVIGIVQRDSSDSPWMVQLSPVDKSTYEKSDFDIVAEAKRIAG